jgi:hypothetical protein
MDMELRHDIADRGDVELVAHRDVLDDAHDKSDLAHQLRPLVVMPPKRRKRFQSLTGRWIALGDGLHSPSVPPI